MIRKKQKQSTILDESEMEYIPKEMGDIQSQPGREFASLNSLDEKENHGRSRNS